MGFLDELKNQADSLRAREQQEQQRLEELTRYYQQEIHPRMTEVYRYLNEMVGHLNYVQPETLARYPVLPTGGSKSFQQTDYKVTIDSTQQIKNITLTCKASLAEPVRVSVEGKEKILQYTELLHSYKLRHNRKDYKDDNYELLSADFVVEGPITITIYFIGDIENSAVNLFLSNFERPGVVKHTLKARHITQEFLDKLARYILRQDDQFLNLDISDDHKQTIRQMLEAEQARREQEIAEMEQQARAEADNDGVHRRLLKMFNKDKNNPV